MDKNPLIPLPPYRAQPSNGDPRYFATKDLRIDYVQQILGPEECKKLIAMAHRDIENERGRMDTR
jgi:hypothetical protein